MSQVIYLDYHSTTPCDPRVVAAMLPYFGEVYGNPSSSFHYLGRKASEAVDEARHKVSGLIGARPSEIVFTGGATESNNLAILGVAHGGIKGRRKIVTTPLEHKSVMEPCRQLAEEGYEVISLPVDRTGEVDFKAAESLIDEHTLLVSVQVANNEIGTIQPVAEITRLARARGALVHCDAAQAVGKVPIDVKAWGIDFLSVSAHKLYGPKGIGALYVHGGPRRTRIRPLAWGGGQEQGLRPGTLNVPGIIGFGEACAICQREMSEEAQRITKLRDALEAQLQRLIPCLQVNGNKEHRLPGNSSLTFPDLQADALILNLPQLALSMGSACNSGALEPSYVLTAIGLTREQASSTVRVGIGRFTTDEELGQAISLIESAYRHLIRIV